MQLINVPTITILPNHPSGHQSERFAIGNESITVKYPRESNAFGGYDIDLNQSSIKVGCQRIKKDEVEKLIAALEGTEVLKEREYLIRHDEVIGDYEIVAQIDDYILLNGEQYVKKSSGFSVEMRPEPSILVDRYNGRYKAFRGHDVSADNAPQALAELKDYLEFFNFVEKANADAASKSTEA